MTTTSDAEARRIRIVADIYIYRMWSEARDGGAAHALTVSSFLDCCRPGRLPLEGFESQILDDLGVDVSKISTSNLTPSPWAALDRFLNQTGAERDLFTGLAQLNLKHEWTRPWLEPLANLIDISRRHPSLRMRLRSLEAERAVVDTTRRALLHHSGEESLSEDEWYEREDQLTAIDHELVSIAASVWALTVEYPEVMVGTPGRKWEPKVVE